MKTTKTKTSRTLTERAAAIVPDFAPITAPPNPQAEQARADMRAYMQPLLQNPPRDVAAQIVTVLEAAALVPSWPLSAPWLGNEERNDYGIDIWIDDPASLFSGGNDD